MAHRDTELQAKQLQAKLQTNHPNATFAIIETSKMMRIGRIVAESKGFEIVEDNGGIMVTAKIIGFDILEVRKCESCGVEILTAAIGEYAIGGEICIDCREKNKAHDAKIAEVRNAEIKAQHNAEAWYYAEEGR